MAFWRWFAFSQGGICSFPGGNSRLQKLQFVDICHVCPRQKNLWMWRPALRRSRPSVMHQAMRPATRGVGWFFFPEDGDEFGVVMSWVFRWVKLWNQVRENVFYYRPALFQLWIKYLHRKLMNLGQLYSMIFWISIEEFCDLSASEPVVSSTLNKPPKKCRKVSILVGKQSTLRHITFWRRTEKPSTIFCWRFL